jgi:hypothetical protein
MAQHFAEEFDPPCPVPLGSMILLTNSLKIKLDSRQWRA